MAYELKITPNRGAVSLDIPGITFAGLVIPTNYVGQQGKLYLMDRVPGLIKNGASGNGAITFNSASLQNVTTITVTADTSHGFSMAPSFGDFINIFNTANFGQAALFEISSSTLSGDNLTRTLNVNHISSSINNYANGTFLACNSINSIPLSDIDYIAFPNNPLTIIGSLDAINGILQTPRLLTWTEFPNDWDVEQLNGTNFLKNFRKTPSNTNDVELTYNVTKNGVQHQDFLVTLKYKSAAELRNPGGLPS